MDFRKTEKAKIKPQRYSKPLRFFFLVAQQAKFELRYFSHYLTIICAYNTVSCYEISSSRKQIGALRKQRVKTNLTPCFLQQNCMFLQSYSAFLSATLLKTDKKFLGMGVSKRRSSFVMG